MVLENPKHLLTSLAKAMGLHYWIYPFHHTRDYCSAQTPGSAEINGCFESFIFTYCANKYGTKIQASHTDKSVTVQ